MLTSPIVRWTARKSGSMTLVTNAASKRLMRARAWSRSRAASASGRFWRRAGWCAMAARRGPERVVEGGGGFIPFRAARDLGLEHDGRSRRARGRVGPLHVDGRPGAEPGGDVGAEVEAEEDAVERDSQVSELRAIRLRDKAR